MTMPDYDAVYLVTLVTVTFGALTFSVLALTYWRERRSWLGSPFARFTAVCAAAFLINLAMRIAPGWDRPLTIALDIVTGLIPPLLVDLAVRSGKRKIRTVSYALGAGAAVMLALDDLDLILVP